ncbi:MAG: GNAT family N-acetyltransferase [Eubacteriaceae bacterium]|nr:GNAT family N-acetyltransferase [Eubacteriaceae bacterium]
MDRAYEFLEQKWDSEFFKMKCARVHIEKNLSTGEFSGLKKKVRNFEFVTIDNNASATENNIKICSLKGCCLVDVPMIFFYEVTFQDQGQSIGIEIGNRYPEDEKIKTMARNSFLRGRFYKDPSIEKSKADDLYGNWIKNAFSRDDKYFVVTEEKTGFILFSFIDKETMDIELIAVDEEYRNMGIAGKMISALKRKAADHGVHSIRVVTQADNIQAINLYFRNGFKLTKCEYTFHCWNR